jgi:hypothetical protein
LVAGWLNPVLVAGWCGIDASISALFSPKTMEIGYYDNSVRHNGII